MNSVLIVGIVFGSIIMVIALICSTVVISRGGGLSQKGRKYHADEARMIQDIYNSLGDMERRVESLETIMLDRFDDRKDEKNDDI